MGMVALAENTERKARDGSVGAWNDSWAERFEVKRPCNKKCPKNEAKTAHRTNMSQNSAAQHPGINTLTVHS